MKLKTQGSRVGKRLLENVFHPQNPKKMNMLELEDKYNISLYEWY